ncbi:MAG: PAS domain S-box protein, partial [Gemmatimonadales bacterium]
MGFNSESLVWFSLIHLTVAGATLGILSIRRRLGVGSLWLWVGALTTICWVSYGAEWRVNVPSITGGPGGVQRLFLGSGVIAPAILMLLLLIYLEHGARDARRLLAGIGFASILFQAAHELARFGGTTVIAAPGWQAVLASPVSLGLSLGVMAVLYQILTTRRPIFPHSLRFGLALLAGIAVDSFVFPFAAFGGLDLFRVMRSVPDFVFAKLLSSLLLTLPVGLYLTRQERLGRRLAARDMGTLAIAGLGNEGPVPDFEVWRSMADALGDGMTAVVDGHLVFANAAMAKIAGFPRAETMAALPLESLVHEEDLAGVLGLHRERQEGTQAAPASFEWRLRRPGGDVRILATTATPALLGSGRVVIGIHRDVTVERETRQQLESSNMAVHALMAGASALVPSLNPENIIASVSEQARRLVGAEYVVFLQKKPGADLLVCRHIEGPAYGILEGEEIRREDVDHFGRLPRSGARRALPLLADGQDLGLLVVSLREDGRDFSWEDLSLLDALGAIGAAALRTAQLILNLRDAERRYATLFDQVPAPVWLYDLETLRIHSANQAAVKRYGWNGGEFALMHLPELSPAQPDRESVEGGAHHSGAQVTAPFFIRHRDREGNEFDVLMTVSQVDIGTARWGLAASVDLTLERRNQERRQVSQRLESLGRLAGGIAHDFNNILTALQVDLDMLVRDYSADAGLHRELAQVRGAVERAADLTRQILLFSRGEEPKRRPVRLNETVRSIERLLMRSLGTTIRLETSFAPEDPTVSADVAQLQLSLVNLCLNARDAMPLGGTLQITTRRTEISAADAERLGMAPGPAAVLAVRDTGSGMRPDVLARAMEPFFTTKQPDRGTGLGLSIVHGVLRAHEGAVEIESTAGVGTTIVLHLPELVHAEPPEEKTAVQELNGAETILLVDDEPAIRRAGARMLERFGYQVILAEDGEDAILKLETAGAVDIVVTDMIMPRCDALGLVQVLHRRWPELPVVLSTGFHDGRLTEVEMNLFQAMVPKPYTPQELIAVVREVLGR